MRVTGIGWTGILTEDFESTLRFFSDVMGLSIAHRDHVKELVHFRFRSGQLLEVFGPSNRGRKEEYQWYHGPVLGFEVDDIQSARQEMIARGTRFISELETWEDDMWSAFLGPEDKLFEILKPSRRPARDSGSTPGICRAGVPVQEFAAAMKFFSQVMEMPLVQKDDGQEVARGLLPGGHLLEVFGSGTRRGQPMAHIVVGFEVDNMAQTRQEMELQGIKFIDPSEVMGDGYACAYFHGPDGFIYGLTDKPKSPSQ